MKHIVKSWTFSFIEQTLNWLMNLILFYSRYILYIKLLFHTFPLRRQNGLHTVVYRLFILYEGISPRLLLGFPISVLRLMLQKLPWRWPGCCCRGDRRPAPVAGDRKTDGTGHSSLAPVERKKGEKADKQQLFSLETLIQILIRWRVK